MNGRISLLWQILRLSVRLVVLRLKVRRIEASNRRLSARLIRLVENEVLILDRQAAPAKRKPPKRGAPLVKTGPGGDFVLEYYPAFGSEAQARRGDLN